MKKLLFIILMLTLVLILNNNIFAITEDFKFVIDTIGIPRYNAYGDEINEDIYYAYNVFSYGNPAKITDKNQRWKNSKYGLWTKNGGAYKGSGTRGEYAILGKSYSGALIYNYYFPMDVLPDTNPEKWTFCSYPGASASWKDTSKYKYSEQLEYMKTQKLMFNDLTSREKADNPKYIREYNITANKIGLSKARLDVAATWKTNGMISTRRNISGVIYSQVYLVKPMAADANVSTSLDLKTDYVLSENEDEILIPIKYAINVINMTGYAKQEHIKELKTELYVDNVKVDENSGSKITSVGNEYMLVVNREKYPKNIKHSIKITNKGYMHTEFVVDGLMRSETTSEISVYVEPKLITPVKLQNIRFVQRIKQGSVVRPLAQTTITNLTDSVGFTEAGMHIAAKLLLNVKLKDIASINAKIDGILCDINIIEHDNKIALEIKVPNNLPASLYGEYSLREKEDSYFAISKSEIGLRSAKPHILEIIAEYNNKKYEEKIAFDTLDDYLTNMNTSNTKTILNWNEFNSAIKLEDWLQSED